MNLSGYEDLGLQNVNFFFQKRGFYMKISIFESLKCIDAFKAKSKGGVRGFAGVPGSPEVIPGSTKTANFNDF